MNDECEHGYLLDDDEADQGLTTTRNCGACVQERDRDEAADAYAEEHGWR